MKILYDYEIFSSQKVGGVSRYFVDLVTSLPNHSAKILAPIHVNQHLDEATRHHKGITLGAYIGDIRGGRYVRSINRAVWNLIHERLPHDLVHLTWYPESLPRKPFAITVHDFIHERFPNHPGNSRTIALKRLAAERANAILCNSEFTAEDARKYYPQHIGKIFATPLAISKNMGYRAEPSQSDPIDGFKQERGEFVLYVGGRAGHKNFPKFIEALSLISPTMRGRTLICFGGGKFNLTEDNLIQDRLTSVGIEVKNVQGSDEELRRLYATANVFVYPSLWEGFGLPILEAFSNDCLVCCSNSSSLPEVAGNAAIYFEPEDVRSLAASIEHALSTPEKSTYRRLGRERLSQFTIEKLAENTQKAYESAK